MEKRFDAFEYDYLLIPDTDDWACPVDNIVFSVELDINSNHGIVEVLREQQQFEIFLRS